MKCLDSSAIIDILRNKKEVIEKIENAKDSIATTRINIFEVLFGIFVKKGVNYQKFSEAIRPLIDKIDILELDEHSSIQAAKIKSELILKGRGIETTDCLIAGIMLANGCNTIITKNIDHFERIKELKIESY